MSMTMKQDPLLLGIVLIVGAMLYSRSKTATAAAVRPGSTPQSVPGNVGSGTAQVAGGIIGALLNTATQPQKSYWDLYQSPGYFPNAAAQSIAWDQASPNVIVPAAESTTGVLQDWTVG
jgi:hypothetical protein